MWKTKDSDDWADGALLAFTSRRNNDDDRNSDRPTAPDVVLLPVDISELVLFSHPCPVIPYCLCPWYFVAKSLFA